MMSTNTRLAWISVFCLTILLEACSSSPSHEDYDMIVVDRKSDRQVNVEYDGACAMAVAQGQFNRPGNRKYMLQHDGKEYYFSSEAAKRKFERDLDANIKRADNNWAGNRAG